MNGIQIPIGGDVSPFLQATAELKAAMADLAAAMRSTLAPAAKASRDASQGMVSMVTGAGRASSSFKGLFGTLSNVGMGMANIAAGAKGLRSAFRFVSGLSGGWKRMAQAAIVAAGAIAGIVVAVKLASAAFRKLLSVASGIWRGISAGARSAAQSIKGIFSGIGSAMPGGGMLGPLAGLAGIAGTLILLKSQLGSGFDLAGEMERTGIALQALTGSVPEASRVMEEMRQTWLRTGVDIAEQSGTIRKFIALGFSTDDALRLQKNILDVAGAVGLTTAEAGLLGSALAQVQAKGIVSMEELRQQIAERGIPVFDLLSKKLGVTQGELMKLVGDGKVPAEALLSIFLNMEGSLGKFAGGADRMGMTFIGIVNRMKGAWSLLKAEFIAPIADSLKPILEGAIARLQTFKESFRAAGKAIGDVLLSTFALIKTGNFSQVFIVGMRLAVTSAMDLLMRGFRAAVAFLAVALATIFLRVVDMLTDPQIATGLKQTFSGLGKIIGGEIKEAISFTEAGRAEGRAKQLVGGQQIALGGANISGGMRGFDVFETIYEALTNGTSAAKDEFGETGQAVKDAAEKYRELMETVRAEVDALRRGTTVPQGSGEDNPFAPVDLGGKVASAIGQAMTLTTSLGRVGGGGFGRTFLPMVSEARKSNNLLTRIEMNTRRNTSIPAIV